MNKCSKCGAEFEGKFCPECGTPRQEEKTCPSCGALLNGGAKFCPECGYSFANGQEPAKTETMTKVSKLYLALHYLPAILLGLFAVLVFAFLAAPAVKLTVQFLGSTSENGYEILKDKTLSSLQGSYIAMIVFGCLALIGAVVTAIVLHKHPAAKLHPVLFVGFAVYLVFLILAGVAIAQVKDLDGGAGMLSAEACPILLIVFSILFALGTIGGVIGKRFIKENVSAARTQTVRTANTPKGENKFIKWAGKHKALVGLFSFLLVFTIIMCSLIPTFILMSKNGTYYACYNGEIDRKEYLIFQNGKWTDETGASGKYSVSGNNITVRIHDELSNTTVSVSGTIKNGVLKLESNTVSATYRTESHKHKCVDLENQNCNGMQTQACNCGLTWNYTSGLKYSGNKVTGIGTASGDIVIPYSHNGKTITSIGDKAFYNCSVLKGITIPNSVTKIGNEAFYGCKELTDITIPNSVTYIGGFAIEDCHAQIIYQGTKAQWNAISRNSHYGWYGPLYYTVHCTDENI